MIERDLNELGWPLAVVASHGQLEVARLLVERGADTNMVGLCGKAPLGYAVEGGHEEMATFLLSNGAKAN